MVAMASAVMDTGTGAEEAGSETTPGRFAARRWNGVLPRAVDTAQEPTRSRRYIFWRRFLTWVVDLLACLLVHLSCCKMQGMLLQQVA